MAQILRLLGRQARWISLPTLFSGGTVDRWRARGEIRSSARMETSSRITLLAPRSRSCKVGRAVGEDALGAEVVDSDTGLQSRAR
jgi:hypothetical protein